MLFVWTNEKLKYYEKNLDKSLTSSDKLKAKSYITERWRQNFKFLHWVLGDLLFQWILSLIRSDASSILKAFTMDNHLLLIFMKLKLGPSNGDLSLRFNMKEEYVSKIVKTWLPKLTNIFAESGQKEKCWEKTCLHVSAFLKIVHASLTVPIYILNALLI